MKTSGTFKSDLKKAVLEKDQSTNNLLEKADSIYASQVFELRKQLIEFLVANIDEGKAKRLLTFDQTADVVYHRLVKTMVAILE